MPLSVASTTTQSPPRNSAVRHQGHGRAGWRRATRQAPHRYAAAVTATATVTTGANSHWVSTACQPNAGSIAPPSRLSLLAVVMAAGSPPVCHAARAASCISLPQTVAVLGKEVSVRALAGEPAGGVPAWSGGRVRLIAAALKAAGRANVPGVRIPPAPQRTCRSGG